MLSEGNVSLCPAALSTPGGEGAWPAVIMFPYAGGMRDTMRQMGERLSNLGYVVLVPDYYYRDGPSSSCGHAQPVLQQGDDGEGHGHDAGLHRRLGGGVCVGTFVGFLENTRAAQNNCWRWHHRLLLRRPALPPRRRDLGRARSAAAASFHGGNLAQAYDLYSPHHNAGAIKADVYVAEAIEISPSP